MSRPPLARRAPRWALAAGTAALALLTGLGFLSSVWLGLAVLVIAAIVLVAAWAWIELPSRYEHGPDRAELAERERWRRMMEGE